MTTWNADLYREKHGFVWQYGESLLSWLNPQPGELVLDLGCGTGELAARIAEAGARTVGLDASPDMMAAAKERHPSLAWQVADARMFEVGEPADAIFSNAALHWVKPPEAVAERIAAALKPGGRFVAELGGKGNVAIIIEAVRTARQHLGLADVESPWFFPSVGEYASILENAGLPVLRAELFERPTKLDGEDGFQTWLTMFGPGLLQGLSEAEREQVLREAETLARPKLYRDGAWWGDYVRLRILAVKP